MTPRSIAKWTAAALAVFVPGVVRASEADLRIPDLKSITFLNGALTGTGILMLGLVVCVIGVAYGWLQYVQTRNLPVHRSMADVSQIIWETCKTYLFQQGKFLAALWVLIAACMAYYFGVLSHAPVSEVVIILLASILGILGSYGVAWFGIRINTVANSRAAFSALQGNPLATLRDPAEVRHERRPAAGRRSSCSS
jgi:K(+)-stimulated pyrophosphate-energized sodium pump